LLLESKLIKKCNGAVFRFDENTNPSIEYRPSIYTLLNLPLSTLVIDYEDFFLDRDHLLNIVSWLDGESISEAPAASPANRRQASRTKSLSLSLRNMDVSEEELRMMIIKLKEARCDCNIDVYRIYELLQNFAKDAHRRHWIMDTDFEADDNLAERLSNTVVGQSMIVSAGAEKPLRIIRE